MKKILPWAFLGALVVFLIAWGMMGIKLLDGDYEIAAEAYTGLVCIIVMGVCGVYRHLSRHCPQCGKLRLTMGAYCPYCGKKID